MRAAIALALCLILAGCDGKAPKIVSGGNDVGSELDEQAIAAGIMPDHANLVFAGRYEVRSELGTDKFCAVSNGSGRFDIGMLAVFGPESKCEARGLASVDGEKVRITLDGKGDCAFDADFDGNELRFPGSVPKGCANYCSDRASISGTSYYLVEPGDDKARRTLGRDIEKLCR